MKVSVYFKHNASFCMSLAHLMHRVIRGKKIHVSNHLFLCLCTHPTILLEAKGKKTQHSVDKLSHSITILSQEQICQFRTEKQPTQDFGSGQQEVLRGDFEKSSIMIPLQDALPVSILQLCTLVNNSWWSWTNPHEIKLWRYFRITFFF